jgi:hypothetical protein
MNIGDITYINVIVQIVLVLFSGSRIRNGFHANKKNTVDNTPVSLLL